MSLTDRPSNHQRMPDPDRGGSNTRQPAAIRAAGSQLPVLLRQPIRQAFEGEGLEFAVCDIRLHIQLGRTLSLDDNLPSRTLPGQICVKSTRSN